MLPCIQLSRQAFQKKKKTIQTSFHCCTVEEDARWSPHLNKLGAPRQRPSPSNYARNFYYVYKHNIYLDVYSKIYILKNYTNLFYI